MYESPIKVFQGNLEMRFEGEILKAVLRADITVDRDELIRALRYDREQYQKGFDDARKGAVPVVHGMWVYAKTYYDLDECNCSLCGQLMTTAIDKRMNYCPNCGAKMDGGAENG